MTGRGFPVFGKKPTGMENFMVDPKGIRCEYIDTANGCDDRQQE